MDEQKDKAEAARLQLAKQEREFQEQLRQYEAKLLKAAEDYQRLSSEMGSSSAQTTALNKQIEELTKKLTQRGEEVARLEDEKKTADETIQDLQRQLGELRTGAQKDFEDQLAAKEQHIADLHKQLDSQKETYEQLVQELRRQIEDQKSKIDNVGAELAQQVALVRQLQEKIEQLNLKAYEQTR